MSELTELQFSTPIGWIRLVAGDGGISSLEMLPSSGAELPSRSGSDSTSHPLLKEVQVALTNYLKSGVAIPDFPLAINGTEFQMSVWRQIQRLGVGETLTYGEIAANIGRPAAVRAVGAAVGANPVPLLIGCHRVLGSGGRITGYSGGDGLPTKRKLLALEKIAYRE